MTLEERRNALTAVLLTNLPLALVLLAGGIALLVLGSGRIASVAAGALIGLGLPGVLGRVF